MTTEQECEQKTLAGFLGEESLGPQASLRVIPCSQTQISTYCRVRGETRQQCDSNPRPLATSAISVARHV